MSSNDFEIKRTVFYGGRAYKRRQESALRKAGFSGADKDEQLRRGAIRMLPKGPFHATPGAIKMADEKGLDVTQIPASRADGKVTQADVQALIDKT